VTQTRRELESLIGETVRRDRAAANSLRLHQSATSKNRILPPKWIFLIRLFLGHDF
jgi:hypothetical protein